MITAQIRQNDHATSIDICAVRTGMGSVRNNCHDPIVQELGTASDYPFNLFRLSTLSTVVTLAVFLHLIYTGC